MKRFTIGCVIVAIVGGLAWAAGDWRAAKDKAHEYKNAEPQAKKLLVEETRKIVREICAAGDDERKSAASSASFSARSNFGYKYGELERTKNDALDMLDRVLNDDNLKEHHGDAREMQHELRGRWEKFEQLAGPLRDGRHPIVEYMLEHGDAARRDYANRCTARHVQVGYAHADCIQARWDTCAIVSVTADNNRAIGIGRDHARRIAAQLEEEIKKPSSDVIKRLIDANSDFAKCKRFESRVDCYRLCPDIDDEGRYRNESPSWRENCS